MARLKDGFKTLYTFSLRPNVKFYEIEVTPPGISGGGENDTTTMRNEEWRTRQPKKLKTLSNSTATVSYDTEVFNEAEVLAMINVNQLITVTFPDGSGYTFWGWLDEFTPGAHVEGEQPTADITIIPSNQNNSGVEVAPIYIPASGTSA